MRPVALMPLMRGCAALLTLCFGVAALHGEAPRAVSDLQRLDASDEAMGTTFSLTLYGSREADLPGAAAAAFEEAHRLDRLLSNYLPASEWSRINREAGREAVEVSSELFELLAACQDYSRESEGAFDITVGPLMRTWGFYKDEGHLPRSSEIAAALDHVGYKHVVLDPVRRTVRFDRAGIELDPGGVGKGYAVDRIAKVLQAHGIPIALISAGGSSIFGQGAPPDNARGWRIRIRKPGDAREPAAEVFLKDMSLSTSGDSEKFFWAGGQRYSHIMDPRTGRPARGASSVSVLSARTIDSEVWAKPYFINGRDWTRAHLPKGVRVFYCDDNKRCSWIE
jgi:thiamine biosynthesis lipoprotein